METLGIPWEELQDDLFASVLSELDSPHVAWVCSVCSSWKTKAQKLLHCIQYHLSDSFPFEELVEQFPALKEVTVVFRGQQQELDNLHRMQELRQLRHLELCNTRSVLEFPYLNLSVLGVCRKLESLTMDGCHFAAQNGIQDLGNLQSLTLVRCAVDVREPTIAQLLQGMAKLKTLRIEHMAGGSCLNFRGLSALVQLEHLILRVRPAAHPDVATEISRMTRLKTLDVNIMMSTTVTTYDDMSMGALAGLPSLECLNLGGHCRLTDDGICEVSRLTNLVSLDVSVPPPVHLLIGGGQNANGITDNGLRHLLHLGELRSLSLSCSKVTNRLMSHLIERFKMLQHLNISHCSQVNDTVLFSLDQCPHLTSLDVSYCRQISDLGLFGISKVARQVQILNLSGCHRLISDLGVRQLIHLHMLKWLSLAYCEEVTDYGIEGLVSGTKYLETLSLRGCYRTTDRAVAIISSELSHIHDLDVGHCYLMSNASVENLLSMRCLRRISLDNTAVSGEHCMFLREKGVAVQRESRWWMY